MESSRHATARKPARSRFGPAGWILAAVVVVFVGVHLTADWVDEPHHRKEVLFEAPIRLRAGEVVQGRFVPEHDGPYAIEVRFRGDAFEELRGAIGGGWAGGNTPAGFTATCVVRAGGEVVHRSTTGDHGLSGRYGRDEVAVYLADVPDGHPVPLDVEVRIDRAVELLAVHPARLRVVASGDWINYAWWEAIWRNIYVTLAMAVALIVLFVAWWLTARRRRRLAEAARCSAGASQVQ